ncbi:MAG: hypothetical protein KDC86_17045 [Saprospiraceae bacterium]|nr:hypothetical protein [Saprospiraceae bacterium]
MRHLITLSSIFLTCGLNAQSPASNHAWLTTDNISVRITPTGIHADSSGGFLLNQPGGNTVNLLSHLTPWIVGEDPAGNLKAACELEDPDFSDWKPGFRGIPNSGKVWKLTNDQIAIHLADFADNGVIDNPIPEIFAWPARGNQYSLDFNGFAVPFEPPGLRLLAEFYDKNDNGMYDPQEGEYPVFAYPGTYRLAGDQIAYAPFYSDALAILTNGKTVQTEARLLAATFECNQQEFLENTVFMDYRFFYSDIEKVHSSIFSLYTDFDIGNPNDDYLGSTLPFSWSV